MASSAVLMNSAVHTNPIVSARMAHSVLLNPSHAPSATAHTVATAWMRALGCVLSICRIPLRAWRKLAMREGLRRLEGAPGIMLH